MAGSEQRLFDAAREYLLEFDEVDEALLERHLNDWKDGHPDDLSEVYRAILRSAKNRQQFANAIGDLEKLGGVLHGFDPHEVNRSFSTWEDVLSEIEEQDIDTPAAIDRENESSAWAQLSKSAVSAASFLKQFEDVGQYEVFVQSFRENEYTLYSLPLVLEQGIHGFGFALACDFLKENGHPEFVKPDTHIKDLFEGIGRVDRDDDFEVFLEVIRFAEAIGERPYVVDKLFWLVGGGNFYKDDLRVVTDKQGFIQRARKIEDKNEYR